MLKTALHVNANVGCEKPKVTSTDMYKFSTTLKLSANKRFEAAKMLQEFGVDTPSRNEIRNAPIRLEIEDCYECGDVRYDESDRTVHFVRCKEERVLNLLGILAQGVRRRRKENYVQPKPNVADFTVCIDKGGDFTQMTCLYANSHTPESPFQVVILGTVMGDEDYYTAKTAFGKIYNRLCNFNKTPLSDLIPERKTREDYFGKDIEYLNIVFVNDIKAANMICGLSTPASTYNCLYCERHKSQPASVRGPPRTSESYVANYLQNMSIRESLGDKGVKKQQKHVKNVINPSLVAENEVNETFAPSPLHLDLGLGKTIMDALECLIIFCDFRLAKYKLSSAIEGMSNEPVGKNDKDFNENLVNTLGLSYKDLRENPQERSNLEIKVLDHRELSPFFYRFVTILRRWGCLRVCYHGRSFNGGDLSRIFRRELGGKREESSTRAKEEEKESPPKGSLFALIKEAVREVGGRSKELAKMVSLLEKMFKDYSKVRKVLKKTTFTDEGERSFFRELVHDFYRTWMDLKKLNHDMHNPVDNSDDFGGMVYARRYNEKEKLPVLKENHFSETLKLHTLVVHAVDWFEEKGSIGFTTEEPHEHIHHTFKERAQSLKLSATASQWEKKLMSLVVEMAMAAYVGPTETLSVSEAQAILQERKRVALTQEL